MIELKCKNCGGKLTADDNKIALESNEAVAIVKSDAKLRCDYCGTEFISGDELSLKRDADIVVNQKIEEMTGGTVVGISFDDFDKLSSPQVTKKKWWQFWK